MSRFGPFELVEPLGSGGVAEVWRARDASSGREVALKRLLSQFAGDRQVRRRFLREAEVARRLDHPHIVPVIDSGDVDGHPYLAMELLAGEDLGRRIERDGRLGAEESWRIAVAVARALAHAHARGVVHRDVKPQNVLLDQDAVKLTDFGLARVEALASLTGSSLLWGSPEYMAPELFGRGRVDPRTDLFSFGVLLHEMVTGRLPWKAGRSPARILGAVGDAAQAPFDLGQGEALDRLMDALLSPSPDDRPASAEEVIAVLEGQRSVAALVRPAACSLCGRPRPEDVPRCFSCGHEEVVLRHITAGGWDVLLTKMRDDSESMDGLHRVLGELTGRSDLKLKFLLGHQALYSEGEKQLAIKVPTVLFSEMDQPTAKEIERRLQAAGLKARAAKRRWLGTWTYLQTRAPLVVSAGIVLWGVVLDFVIRGKMHPLVVATSLFTGGLVAVIGVVNAIRSLAGEVGRFRLRPARDSAPVADRLLGAAQQASAGLSAPEVRALFIDISRGLYRLTRRGEELERLRPAGSSEGALARRLLEAAPALGARLESLTRRLEALDAALERDGEEDFSRVLAALERRHAGAAEHERPALEVTLRDLEAAFERRLAGETEREQLAASLCRMLATVRDVYGRAAAIETAEERELAAIDAALRELDAAAGA